MKLFAFEREVRATSRKERKKSGPYAERKRGLFEPPQKKEKGGSLKPT